MCGPGAEPPFVWACYAGTLLALFAVWPILRRRVGPRLGRTLIVVALLVPTLLITLLHLSLPRDCLTGRTDAGECGRDRELR